MLDNEQTAILAAMNARLDATLAVITQALNEHDREFAIQALGTAVILMDPAALADLAFAATLRLVDQKVADSE